VKKLFTIGVIIGGAIIAFGFLMLLSATPTNWMPNVMGGLIMVITGLIFALYVFWNTIGSYIYSVCKKKIARWLKRE
jgi:hypothetical protein